MRRLLRIVGFALALSAGLAWLALGANRGWTKTRVPIRTLDAVTGIEGIDYEKRFVPGVDFLAATLLSAAILEGLSFIPLAQGKKAH
jgi:hypothetical protein